MADDQPKAHRLLGRLLGWTRSEQLVVAALAVVVGGVAAGGAIVFRELIAVVQTAALGFGSERVYTLVATQPWWRVLLAPTTGGLLIGLLVYYLMPGRRPQGVADVIAATAMRNARMPLMPGLGAAAVSAASIGVGASVGREGPVVHLGASLGGWLAKQLHLSRGLSIALVGSGVASAVAASFNAPIAGVIFALEVVIGHYALNTFAPVVIAGVTGTVISRIYFGDFPAFVLPEHTLVSVAEVGFAGVVGVAAAVVAIGLVRGVFLVQDVVERTELPIWARPALGGLCVGAIALVFPQVLGVGYEATDAALRELLPLWLLAALLGVKLVATVVSLGCGFGGGVFSPSLFLGAMLGGTLGTLFGGVVPHLTSGHGAYTLIGMGAVAGAVLGAPISTILIVFEMTGDYGLTVTVMVAVVIASVITRQLLGHSFFTLQLERWGLSLAGGREARILRSIPVEAVMRDDYETVSATASLGELRERLLAAREGWVFVVDEDGRLVGTVTLNRLGELAFDTSRDQEVLAVEYARRHPPVIALGETLDKAIEIMSKAAETHIAVVRDTESMKLLGALMERDVMTAYNRALLQARAEERGE